MLIIILPIPINSADNKEQWWTKKSVSHRMFHTHHIQCYGNNRTIWYISKILSAQILPHHGGVSKRTWYILLRNHKATLKGVYMVYIQLMVYHNILRAVYCYDPQSENNYKIHIFLFSIVTCEQKIGKTQRNVWRKVAKNMVSPHNNSLIITITNLYEMF